MRWLRLVAILLVLGPASQAPAVQPDEILKDPAQEARARELSKQLRCMVCQNQSIDDSDAPLARDLRILVRERLQAGDSNSQVLDFLVQRYGEFVLLRPRLHWRTALLWLAPPVLLIGGGLILLMLARRRRGAGPVDAALPQGGALTPDEERRLAGLMKPEDR
ncbi:MAG: cytochrome c-type biogenesis protein CcmH [Xanthobacteraceae bacterium]|nr:cytochrome c-type biogenesis protein CcmH [Xanthobacteraceae bacterium]